MKKALALSLLCFIFFTPHVHAQDEDIYNEDEGQAEADWYGELPSLYSAGDMTFNISPGITFPVLFTENGKPVSQTKMTAVGGAGALAFNYFLSPHFFLGGEIGGKFIGTLAKNTHYLIPIGLRTGYQFLIWKFEIPLSLVIGIAPQRYLNMGYAGLFIKGGPAVYYRFNPDWSFGLDLSWSWYPQLNTKEEKDAHGNYINLILSARYHF